jgi:hypothetical protein
MKRIALLLVLILAAAGFASAQQAATSERWLHVRVESTDSRDEMVRVNVPLSLAEKVLPAINHNRLHNGRVTFDGRMEGVDLRAVLQAVRDSRDGEFVTVQSHDNDVRVAKQDGNLLVQVQEKKNSRHGRVEVRVPMSVVNALLSTTGGNELDLVAAIRALSAHGDAELVNVKDDRNTVRVWVDSKNTSE